ncbi:peptidase M6 immune inhibitor A [Actinoplanes sp. NPDC023936]|uniref:peptidase M6 immune inhibitor A n=1 Tax=Actinoplanes sp. NPDC023936 TaxID=3154910 RepID=UPI0033E10ED1
MAAPVSATPLATAPASPTPRRGVPVSAAPTPSPAPSAVVPSTLVPSTPVPSTPAPSTPAPAAPAEDARDLTPPTRLTLNGEPLPPATYEPGPLGRRAAPATPPVGTVRSWAGLNEVESDVYRKDYVLRAVGEHIEVWVAKDLGFPIGDCRGDAATEITDAQIAGLVREFDENIYPTETAAFSTPPDRTGANAAVDGDFTGAGNRTVTLVDNIRDDNFVSYPERPTYIAGFFSEQLNELFDRNVITIDAFDWAHRLGADPAHQPTEDLCTSRPARPRMYESTFAHEWQHLLSYYADPNEENWLDEGLSDYAQTLTGYVDSRLGVYHRGFDNHLACYQGFGGVKTANNPNPRDCDGPANSLNLWNEGRADAVLADYGITYQLMLYLGDRFGPGVLSALHRDADHRGLDALAAALPAGTRFYDVLHDFQTMTLVDKSAGEPGSVLKGASRDRVTAGSLRSTVNLSSAGSHGAPGAPPNGADYVRLPTTLRSVSFQGAATLPPLPLGWTIDKGMLFSGNASSLDTTAVRAVDVPVTDPNLRFTTTYALEKDFDYGYVTISTDGGRTYRAVAGDATVAGPLGAAITGRATGATVRYDLSEHAGNRVLLGFRYVSDSAVNQGGWHIGDVTVGARKIGSATLDEWRSPTQVRPTPVHNWHVMLVGLGRARAKIVPLEDFDRLNDYPKVAAIVAYDEPTGTAEQYAPYTLVVNGETLPRDEPAQAGGSTP